MRNLEELLKNIKQVNTFIEPTPLNTTEKEILLNKTMAKINAERKVGLTMSHKKRFTLLVAATLSMSVIAISATTLFQMNDTFAKYFNFNAEKEQSKPLPGMDVKESVTEKDVTIDATQVVGDGYGFYVLLEVKAPHLSSKCIDFENINVTIDKADTLSWNYVIASHTQDTTSIILNVQTSENLIGQKINLTLTNLLTDTSTLQASWPLSWTLDYKDVSKLFDVNQMIDLYGGKALFKTVAISPFSVYVNLVEKEAFSLHGGPYDDTIIVTLNDGTVLTSTSDNTFNDTTTIGMTFGKIIDLSTIKSITFAGTQVPITLN